MAEYGHGADAVFDFEVSRDLVYVKTSFLVLRSVLRSCTGVYEGRPWRSQALAGGIQLVLFSKWREAFS